MAHYYASEPDSPSEERRIEFSFNGQDFHFVSDSGVFSKNHVDKGSEYLLMALHAFMQQLKKESSEDYPFLASGRALDLGCGYGVLGIVAKRLWPGQRWTFSDVNRRALDLTRRNAEANGIYHADVRESAGFDNLEGPFELIVSNPPIRTGKETIYGLFEEAERQLVPGGFFICVIGKKQGAASARHFLESRFHKVEVLFKKKGFSVFACRRQTDEQKAGASE